MLATALTAALTAVFTAALTTAPATVFAGGSAPATTALAAAPAELAPVPLRVCADPDNLPFSREDGSGFENRIAQVMADALGRPLETAWMPQLRGLVRKTLGSGACDMLMGVPVDLERVLPTRPYYRSSYVFVTRADEPRPLRSFDDPRLRTLSIGVQLVGSDLAATPPGHALAQRGATEHVVGYTVMGDAPAAARMVQALAERRLDAALVWGPQAGYFAAQSAVPMSVAIARAPAGLPMPFEFDIAMAVRPGDTALRDALDAAIEQRRAQIDAILARYQVPRTDAHAVAGVAR